MRNASALLVCLIAASCSPIKTAMKNGDYDRVVYEGVKKIRKDRISNKQILMFEEAWNIALKRDLDEIVQLKTEGSPEAWVTIADLYAAIDERQDLVKPHLPLFIKKEFRNAVIEIIDVNAEFATAKQKAAEFLYETAIQKLTANDKLSARDAWYDLNKIKTDYFSSFRDVDEQMKRAIALGTNHVLITVVNSSGMILPQDFEAELHAVDLYALKQDWLDYDVQADTAVSYDYFVVTHVSRVEAGPDFVKEREYKTERDVKDGWKYLTDDKGNYVLDSLGNKIKVDNIIHTEARVLETSQQKTTVVAGSLDFHDAESENLLRTISFEQIMHFENIWLFVIGDKRALSDQQAQLLNNKPLPFPATNQMVMDAAVKIRTDMVGMIRANASVLLQ